MVENLVGIDDEPPAIEIENVSVSIAGVPVLDNISFTINHGSMVALVGPNGAGKSTLFKSILGLMPVGAGRIRIHGSHFSKVSGELAYIPQNEDVNWSFPISAWDVVMLGRQRKIGFFKWPRKIDKEICEYSLNKVDLYSRKDSLMSELSGGQRQRIFVARALAQEAHTLLLDEAFSGVDVGSQDGLMDMLKTLRDDGKTIFISTHDLNNMADKFDLCCCLNKHICSFGPPDQAFTPEVLEELYGSHSQLMLGVRPE